MCELFNCLRLEFFLTNGKEKKNLPTIIILLIIKCYSNPSMLCSAMQTYNLPLQLKQEK